MTNVYLYGELRNKFGDEFKFNINSPKEALLAINANKKGFLDEVKKLAMKGIHYRIIVDENVIQHPKEVDLQKAPEEIHIVPIVWGAGKNGAAIGMIVVGAALIAATGGFGAGIAASLGTSALAAGGSMATLGTTLGMIGAALAVQGVMTLLFPQPKPDFNQEVQAGGKSYLFGNKPSNTSQGQAVPVGYGRLKIGSSQISSSTDHYALDTDIKQLMTPVDKPINDYLELVAQDESSPSGPKDDTFSSNQAVDMDDTVTLSSVTVLNSYIDINTTSVEKVFSNPAEVVVTRNGDIISNPNLTTFDENITFEWEEVSNSSEKGKVFIENPYTMKLGLVARSYHVPDFKVQSEFIQLKSNQSGYFQKYAVGDLVKFGPTQFDKLKFAVWDSGYQYFSGELVVYPTGNPAIDTYFQAKVIAGGTNTGFSGLTPTGVGNSIRNDYWRKVTAPNLEYLYKCTAPVSGHLPTTGELNGGAPVAESNFWTRVESPTTSGEMETLFNDYPAFEDGNQYVYVGEINRLNEQTINGTEANVDNYGMEFLGYFYVPTVGDDGKSFVKDIYEIGTATGLYEIIKIGNTGQWSAVGFTGLNGAILTPKVGSTFCKNSTQGNGDGKVMIVGAYQFKIDSDDAADLYIDSTLASSYYGGHALTGVNPTNDQINSIPSTTTTLYLTAGYHRLYARYQDLRGAEGISIYYKYDTNRDDSFSNWQLVPKTKLFHSPQDLNIPKIQKFLDVGKKKILTADMVIGKRYKIFDIGSTSNWTSIGAAASESTGSVQAGRSVFYKTSTAANGSGFVVENFVNYAEEKSAASNRIVRFISERPDIKGVKSSGYSAYKARYRCKVNINNKQIIYSSPVKINISFFSTSTTFRGTGEPILSQKVQTA
jgi:predicted phage tail protein